MSKLPILLLTLLTLFSCASGRPDKKDKTHAAPHGGVVVQGKKYFLEIVSSKKHVHLYPLQENEAGTLEAIPMKNVRIVAEYSPHHSKADYSLNLNKRHEHYYGNVDTHGEKTYEIHVDMRVGKTREDFLYDMKKNDLKAKVDPIVTE
jgi:hypothetical protein